MPLRLPLLAAAFALSLPAIPASAQTWPAAVVAGAPRAAPVAGRPFVVLRDDDVSLRRSTRLPPTDPNTSRRLTANQDDPDEIPEVEVRPRAEWTDDEGLRVSPTRLAFKRRF